MKKIKNIFLLIVLVYLGGCSIKNNEIGISDTENFSGDSYTIRDDKNIPDECEDDRFCLVNLSKEEIFFEKIPLSGNTERDIATAFGMEDYLSTVKDNTNSCCENGSNCLANNWEYWMIIPKYGIKIFSSSFTKDNIKKENFVNGDIELDPLGKGSSYTPFLSIHRILSGETFIDAIKRNRPEWEKGEQPSYWDGKQRKKMGIVKQGEYKPVLMELDQELIRTYSGARLAPELTPLTGFDTKIRKPRYVRFGHNINTANPDSFKIFQYGDSLIFYLKSHPDVFFSIYHHYIKPQSPTCPEYLFDSIE